jgi:hypothetical protein
MNRLGIVFFTVRSKLALCKKIDIIGLEDHIPTYYLQENTMNNNIVKFEEW